MSRAFVKEPDGDDVKDDLPERTVSSHPNYITGEGLNQLREELRRCESEQERLRNGEDDFQAKLQLAKVERDLRYFRTRLEQAIPVNPEEQDTEYIRFGMQVEVFEGEKLRLFRIVGEDEALLGENLISWVSPLARAVLGTQEGDLVRWKKPGSNVTIEILSFGYTLET